MPNSAQEIRYSMTRPVPPNKAPTVFILPKINFRGRKVYCNGKALDLSRRPLTLRLFRAFATSSHHVLSKDELMGIIYPEIPKDDKSARYLTSLGANLTKLISRARTSAERSFCRGKEYRWIEWFVYDQTREHWHFFRLANNYLMEKEEQLMMLTQNAGTAKHPAD